MLLLGFGLSGSSAPPIMGEKNISSGTADVSNRQLPLMPSLNTAPCENSMCSTADVFWHVIDPDRSAKYVEIRPSTFIVFDMEDSREIHASDGADSTSRPLSEPPKVRWQLSSLRKPSGERRFLTDRHPAVFTVAIVSLLLFCVLLCVLLSGVVLMCTGVKRPFRRTQRRPLSTGFEERACDDDSWKRNCCGSVLTFPTSNGVDVDALSMVDDVVAWSCFQTQVRYVAGSEDFRRRIVRRQTQGRRRGRIKILETYIFAERVLMAIGMDNGSVEVWDLDANCLIIKDTCAGPAVSRIIFGMVGSNLYTFAGKVNGVLSVLQVPLSHNSSMAQKHPFSTILDKHNGTIRDIYLDWRGSLYTASDDSTVHCWKASNSNVGLLEWSVSHVFLGHKCAVKSLACDSAARLLATGCSDGEIFIWDLETRRPLAKIFRGDSDDDDSLRSGHIGAITKLFVTQTQSGINSAKYVICSAGSDERVHFWELTATVKEDVGNGKPMASNRSRSSSAPTAAPRNFAVRRDSFVSREPSILSNRQSPGAGRDSKGDDDRVFPLVELEHLGSLHQTGCTTIALHGWLLAGARTVPILGRATEGKCWTIPGIVRRLWNMIFATGPPLENARMESGGDWVWEVWMTDVRTWKRSHYLETVFIGKDDLRGLGSATTDDLDEKTAVSHSIKKCKSRRHPDNRAKRSGDSLQMPIGTSLCGRAGILTSSDTEEASANQQLSGSQLAIAPQHVNGGGAIRENMPGISGNNEKIDRGPDSARSPDGLLDPNLSLPHDRGTTTSDPVDLQIAVAENTPPPSFLTSTPNRLEPDYAPKYIWSDSESQASSSQSASASSTANEREGSIMPDGTSSEASEDTDRMFQEEQIPVFHIRSISASDAGIAIAFGNSVKVLFFGDDLDEARAPVRPATDDSAANRRSYGWELYDETAEGKLHAA
ncbi:hypothetical protein DFJ77DRAFT_264446 [Powellomyces hirtus]|nr:hypothetical protein DFJ77DRAFT_264446 [Powellomyces hirtus]